MQYGYRNAPLLRIHTVFIHLTCTYIKNILNKQANKQTRVSEIGDAIRWHHAGFLWPTRRVPLFWQAAPEASRATTRRCCSVRFSHSGGRSAAVGLCRGTRTIPRTLPRRHTVLLPPRVQSASTKVGEGLFLPGKPSSVCRIKVYYAVSWRGGGGDGGGLGGKRGWCWGGRPFCLLCWSSLGWRPRCRRALSRCLRRGCLGVDASRGASEPADPGGELSVI